METLAISLSLSSSLLPLELVAYGTKLDRMAWSVRFCDWDAGLESEFFDTGVPNRDFLNVATEEEGGFGPPFTASRGDLLDCGAPVPLDVVGGGDVRFAAGETPVSRTPLRTNKTDGVPPPFVV